MSWAFCPSSKDRLDQEIRPSGREEKGKEKERTGPLLDKIRDDLKEAL